ncbi:MAG: hypothetical protein MR908_09185 [Firmicutes bacterium]|nr:hypothetical protein [Bacillota bacterium]
MEAKSICIDKESTETINGYRIRRRYGNADIDSCLLKIVQMKFLQVLQNEKDIVT